MKYLSFLRARVNMYVCVFWTFVGAEILREPGFHIIALTLAGLAMVLCDSIIDKALAWYGIPPE